MRKFENIVEKISRIMDHIAGWGIVATMVLVIVNILLRVIFKSPIQGVYEYVGYLTAAVIGFAIAFCALQKAHIAIDILAEKLGKRVQNIVDSAAGGIILVFLSFCCYQVLMYANKVMTSGEVSATAHVPFYPFIFMVAAGLSVLCLVELMRLVKGVIRR
jgi:TRAP-type C4-dicarboxylate transport system permease small subunit